MERQVEEKNSESRKKKNKASYMILFINLSWGQVLIKEFPTGSKGLQ